MLPLLKWVTSTWAASHAQTHTNYETREEDWGNGGSHVPEPVCFTERGSDWENKEGEWRSKTVKDNKTTLVWKLFLERSFPSYMKFVSYITSY